MSPQAMHMYLCLIIEQSNDLAISKLCFKANLCVAGLKAIEYTHLQDGLWNFDRAGGVRGLRRWDFDGGTLPDPGHFSPLHHLLLVSLPLILEFLFLQLLTQLGPAPMHLDRNWNWSHQGRERYMTYAPTGVGRREGGGERREREGEGKRWEREGGGERRERGGERREREGRREGRKRRG